MKKITIPLLCVQLCLIAMILSSSGLAMPRLAEELGFTSVQQGSMVSIQFLGFTLGVLIGGTLVDSYGGQKILRAAFAGLGAATLIFGFSRYYIMTMAGIFFIGFFGSICQNAIVSLTTAYDTQKADSNIAFINVFFTVGAIITPLLLLMFTVFLGMWRITYYIIGILFLGMALYTVKYKGHSEVNTVSLKNTLKQYKIVFTRPINMVAPLTLFLYVAAETGLWGFAPMFFESRGYGKISGIAASIFIWAAMFAGRTLSVRLIKSIDMVRILLVHGILAIISFVMVIYSNQGMAIAWFALAGFACSPFYPLLTIWITRLTGEKSSTMLAFNMGAGALGPVVMGLFTGMIVSSYGSSYTTAVPAFAMLLAVIILFLFRNRKSEHYID
ncbi:MFS transporter [Ruminiclostridium josui]|uniref:MFS transporter n=1 Tax=Ruminiclostridium josui TaxID=1499 RepID=UPI000466522E|nr:MFS transporter [Ruminiclostridium josui]